MDLMRKITFLFYLFIFSIFFLRISDFICNFADTQKNQEQISIFVLSSADLSLKIFRVFSRANDRNNVNLRECCISKRLLEPESSILRRVFGDRNLGAD